MQEQELLKKNNIILNLQIDSETQKHTQDSYKQNIQQLEESLAEKQKELDSTNIKIIQPEQQVQRSYISIKSIKNAISLIMRPSVIMGGVTALTLGLLVSHFTPLVITAYVIGTTVGIECFSKIRNTLASKHLDTHLSKTNNENCKVIPSTSAYFDHGKNTEQSWSAYLNPRWTVAFLPSFLNNKSKDFQMGREAKRREIATSKSCKNFSPNL